MEYYDMNGSKQIRHKVKQTERTQKGKFHYLRLLVNSSVPINFFKYFVLLCRLNMNSSVKQDSLFEICHPSRQGCSIQKHLRCDFLLLFPRYFSINT